MLRKKNQRKAEEESKGGATTSSANKTTAAEIRLRKEFAEIDLPTHAKVTPDPDGDITKFGVTIDLSKEDCLWKGGKYEFRVDIPFNYPHEAPRSTATHPSTIPTSTQMATSASTSCALTGSQCSE